MHRRGERRSKGRGDEERATGEVVAGALSGRGDEEQRRGRCRRVAEERQDERGDCNLAGCASPRGDEELPTGLRGCRDFLGPVNKNRDNRSMRVRGGS